MASIDKRVGSAGRVTYHVQVRLRGYPPVTKTFQRVTDARQWAQQIEAKMRQGDGPPSNEARRHTLSELADRYLDVVARRTPHALAKQKLIFKWWRGKLGAYTLVNVTPSLISSKRDELLSENVGRNGKRRSRSPSTANRYLAALSSAFKMAMKEWHWVRENPVHSVSKEPEPPGRVRYLDDGEREALLTSCRASPLPQLELIVLLALTTGMRRGEILGLRWPDIDLERKLAIIQKSKNGDRRSAPLVPRALELLKREKLDARSPANLVFAQVDKDKPVNLDHWFKAALKTAEVANFRFHDLRHTAASYLAMSGSTPPEIAAVLGHRTLQMVKRYAHLSDAHTSSVVQRMTSKYFR